MVHVSPTYVYKYWSRRLSTFDGEVAMSVETGLDFGFKQL